MKFQKRRRPFFEKFSLVLFAVIIFIIIICNVKQMYQQLSGSIVAMDLGSIGSSYTQILETPCTKDEAPIFVTFAVSVDNSIWDRIKLKRRGRWSSDDGARALRILYSSLVRSHGCSVQLHVHSNMPPEIARNVYIRNGPRGYSTMGTQMNGIVFHEVNKTYWNNPYNDMKIVPHASKWFALSRAKLDTFEEYLIDGGPQPVWIDLDTVVFDRAAVNSTVPWVYGYHHGNKTRNHCFGDMFSLDTETLQEVRRLENELINENKTLPTYDLQGYFSILMERQQKEASSYLYPVSLSSFNNSHAASLLHVVQEDSPNFAFGFDCSADLHPEPRYLKDRVRRWNGEKGRLMCKNLRGEDTKVASMSFTAPTYKSFFLESNEDTAFDVIVDEGGRNALNEFFYKSSIAI
mmetsp:Transcript_6874/g.8452  ORF Transcript_6874/g.8452 Transcript_6874/m.8452 type:complete len:405 (-) Transcript_6874:1223-2437(-)